MEYHHKLTGSILIIKKDYGEVASCFAKERLIPGFVRKKTNVVICAKKNLKRCINEPH